MSFNNRPERPLKASLYLRLVTENVLRNETIRKFYSTVKTNSPENVLGSFDTQDDNGNPANALLLHRINEEQKHEYEIPLHRNLTSDEMYSVVKKLDKVLNEGDFLFESSTVDLDCCPDEDEEVYMDENTFEMISEKLSAKLHEKWLNERENDGWKYGSNRCDESRTHPLMKPWSQLTENEKNIDYSMPEFFIDLLYEHGYSIVSDKDLKDLL